MQYTGNAEPNSKKLLLWIIPVWVTGLFLAYFLDTSLIIVSTLLFSYLIYLLDRNLSDLFIRKLFLFVFLVTIGSRLLFLLKNILHNHLSLTDTLKTLVGYYKICYLSASYQSFGFIKRGLIPTIVNFISPDYIVQIYTVQLIGLLVFLTGIWLISKTDTFDLVPRKKFAAVLLLAPIGIYQHFNFSFGFYDMILLGLLMISVSLKNRKASIFIDIIGLLVHEAYVFIRLPFLLFNLISLIAKKKPFAPALLSICINSLVFLLIIFSPRPGFEDLKTNYFAHYSSLKPVTGPEDLEAFYPLCREGTLAFDFNIIKQYFVSAKAVSYYFPFLATLISIGFFSCSAKDLSAKNRLFDTMAAITAFLFPWLLGLVGGDYGRWLGFSYVTWAIYYFLYRPRMFAGAITSFIYVYAILFAAFLFSPFGINYNFLFYKLLGH